MLYERVLSRRKMFEGVFNVVRGTNNGDAILNAIETAPKMIISDVAEYANKFSDGGPTVADIPCPRAPFKVVWMEYGDNGVLLYAETLEDDVADQLAIQMSSRPSILVNAYPFYIHDVENGETEYMGGDIYYAALDARGEIIADSGKEYIICDPDWEALSARFGVSELWKAIQYRNVVTALLACSFANCKNVNLVQRTASKQRSRRSPKVKHYKYYVLDIHPMRKIISDNERSTGDHSFRTAMHLCRGHFKDYRESGLFGKNKGIYWWDAQVRGNAENGVIEKDYQIHTN